MSSSIPLYSLYGQQISSAVELRFLHIESLESSNQAYRWNIRPHRHNDLHQLIWVERGGGGSVMLDDRTLIMRAPVLLSIPSLIVHGFQWLPGSEGLILTIADSFMADLVRWSEEPRIATMLEQLLVIDSDQERRVDERLRDLFNTILDEYIHDRACRGAAITGTILTLFAEVARMRSIQPQINGPTDLGATAQYRRFKELVEQHFRERWRVADYARELATTERTLRRLSTSVVGLTPGQIVQRRVVLEAQRNLLYTEHTVAEIGYRLGFEDPAYFTRFFTRNVGETPAAFRAAHNQSEQAARS